tara:strand:+ start:488 stop:688 length:201 start_codon:yes stop_codon:yes gene_type:complete
MNKVPILMMLLISTSSAYSCSNNNIDPDGENVFFYEECLHMERKFNDAIHAKCKKYSEKMRNKEII